jgi:hypothetical protein
MLPGFTASSSLYLSSRVYRGYGAALAGNFPGTAGTLQMANGTVPGSWCKDTPCPQGTTCCQKGVEGSGQPYAACYDLQADPANCGWCGHECLPYGVCCNGRCIAPDDNSCGCSGRVCGPGQRCCVIDSEYLNVPTRIECRDLDTNENCGSCGHRCPHLAKCMNGSCCYPKGLAALAAIILCLLFPGANCNELIQQAEAQACP